MSMHSVYYERERAAMEVEAEADLEAQAYGAEAEAAEDYPVFHEPMLEEISKKLYEAALIQDQFDEAENQREVGQYNCDNPGIMEGDYLLMYCIFYKVTGPHVHAVYELEFY